MVCGIPFSGKSTLAKIIVNKLGYELVDLDGVKFEIYGDNVKDDELEKKDWDLIYQSVYQRIENLLGQGKTVVYDTGNFTKYERGLVRQIAEKLRIKTQTILVDTPKNTAYERLLKNRKTKMRFDVSDKDFGSAVNEMEPPTEDEKVLVFRLNDDVDTWVCRYIDY